MRVIREGLTMWTAENRGLYERKGRRYPSDLSDEEWALVEPEMPPQRRGRRYPAADRREVLNAILYVLSTGWALRIEKSARLKSVEFHPIYKIAFARASGDLRLICCGPSGHRLVDRAPCTGANTLCGA